MEQAKETQKYRLIAEIKRHPPIYESDGESKYGKETYDLSWEDVSKQLGMTVSACQRDWAKIKQDYDEHVIKYDNQALSFPKYLDGTLDFLKPETDNILQSTSNITLTNLNHVIEFKSENDEKCSSNKDIDPLAKQDESDEKEFIKSNNIEELVLVDDNKHIHYKFVTGEQHDMFGKLKLRHAKRLRKPKRKQDTSSKHYDSYFKKKILKSEDQHLKFADFVNEQQDVDLVSNDSESIYSDDATNIDSSGAVRNKSDKPINSNFEEPVLSDTSQKKAAERYPQLLKVLDGDNCCTKGTAEQQDFRKIMLKPAKKSESDTIQNEKPNNKINSYNIITGKYDLPDKTSGNVLTTFSTEPEKVILFNDPKEKTPYDNANGSRSINEGQSSNVMPRELDESTNIRKYPLLDIPVPPLIYFPTKTKNKPISSTRYIDVDHPNLALEETQNTKTQIAITTANCTNSLKLLDKTSSSGSNDTVSKEVTSILDVNVEQTDMNIFFDEITQYITRTYPLEDQIRIRSKICNLVSKAEIEEKL